MALLKYLCIWRDIVLHHGHDRWRAKLFHRPRQKHKVAPKNYKIKTTEICPNFGIYPYFGIVMKKPHLKTMN